MKLMRYLLMLLISLFSLASLNGCGSSVPILKPYKLDIQQGNVVTSKMLLQLKPGMTKSQVRYIMGTPLIVDSFHKDRWDYFYQMRQGGKVMEQRRVILDFEKDTLARVRGDVVPQGTAGAATGEVLGATTTADMLKEKEEKDKGLLDKLQFWKSDKKPELKPVEATAPIEVPKPAARATTAKVPEKSWTEKLKFWKKDETPVTKPLEVPKEVAAPAEVLPEIPAALEAAEEVPSLLAVPIGVLGEKAPEADKSQVVVAPIAAPVPTKVDPPKPVAAPSNPTSGKPAPAPIKAVQPIAPSKPVPKNKQDEKMIFRLDRTLKLELLEPEVVPAPAPEPVVEKPVEKMAKPKKKAVEEPLPAETEPGFFDRMLEKIGF